MTMGLGLMGVLTLNGCLGGVVSTPNTVPMSDDSANQPSEQVSPAPTRPDGPNQGRPVANPPAPQNPQTPPKHQALKDTIKAYLTVGAETLIDTALIAYVPLPVRAPVKKIVMKLSEKLIEFLVDKVLDFILSKVGFTTQSLGPQDFDAAELKALCDEFLEEEFAYLVKDLVMEAQIIYDEQKR